MDIFNLYSKMILRGLGDLKGFIIGKCNHNNIWYTVNTVDGRLTTKTELSDKVLNESKKKRF